jgi:hypothetical protein
MLCRRQTLAADTVGVDEGIIMRLSVPFCSETLPITPRRATDFYLNFLHPLTPPRSSHIAL